MRLADARTSLFSLRGSPSRRRQIVLVGAVGMAGTLALIWATTPSQVGATTLAPWVMLLSFELGYAASVAVSLLATVGYLSRGLIGPEGEHITAATVASRFVPLLVVGLVAAWAASRMKASENAYRSLIERLPLAAYIAQIGRFEPTFVTPPIEELTGRPASESLDPEAARSMLHPEDRDEVIAARTSSPSDDSLLSIRYRIIRPDGQVVWLRDSSVPIEIDKITYRQGFLYDITPQREASLLREHDAQLMQALLDGAMDGMCLTDRDGNVLLDNAPMRQAVVELGIPRSGTIPERLTAIADRFVVPDAYREAMQQLAVRPDEASFHEFELRDTGRALQGFTSPVITEDGTYVGRIWTLRDVTEARRLEQQQRSFVASVSHELRTPLTSILGYTELLEESLGSGEEGPARHLAVIARNAHRLRSLVDDLLFVAQVDAGRFELRHERVDLEELARASHEAALPAAHARQLELELSVEATPVLTGDPGRLAQALDNLVSNAIKFTPEHGKVEIAVSSTNGSALLVVTDNGVGIPESEQARIGERFFRSTTATSLVAGGTGLGIAIVKMIVEAHEGRFTLSSEPGQGTTATIELPLRPR